MLRFACIHALCITSVGLALHGAARPDVMEDPYTLFAARAGISLSVQTDDKCVRLSIVQQANVISQTLVLEGNQMFTENPSTAHRIPSPTLLSLMVSGNYPVALGKPSEKICVDSTYAQPMRFLFFGSSPLVHAQLAHATRKLSGLAKVTKRLNPKKIKDPIIIVDLQELLTQFYGQDWPSQLPWMAIPQYNLEAKSVAIITYSRQNSAARVLEIIKKHRTKPVRTKSRTIQLNRS